MYVTRKGRRAFATKPTTLDIVRKPFKLNVFKIMFACIRNEPQVEMRQNNASSKSIDRHAQVRLA